MVETIQAHTAGSSHYTGINKISQPVIQAISEVSREDFVPIGMKRFAYDDSPLPIGEGQTISQPFIVALMCELLGLSKEDRVLDVGAGCGYHSAVLSKLTAMVYAVERVPSLAKLAEANLKNYPNVEVRCDDGKRGWAEKAPFQGINVAASASNFPEGLAEQLAPGGKMVLPLKSPDMASETLTLVIKEGGGGLSFREVLPVSFVPLV